MTCLVARNIPNIQIIIWSRKCTRWAWELLLGSKEDNKNQQVHMEMNLWANLKKFLLAKFGKFELQ